MLYVLLVLGALLLLIAVMLLVQSYIGQLSAMYATRNLIDHLLRGRQSRRVHEGPGPAGELSRAINRLATDLEQRTLQAQQDQDHLLALLKVLDHTDEFVIATDSLDVVRLINPAAAKALGQAPEALLGKPVDALLTQPELLGLYRKAFTSSAPVAAQVTLHHASGQTLHCQATAATIYNRAHYRGTLLLMRDVTEIVRTLQIKTDFVANASHELRTPLASIRAAVETIEDCSDDRETTQRCVGIIGSQALRLQMLVQDLLDLSRTEDPRAAVRADRLDLAEICAMISGMYAQQADAKGLTLHVNLAADAHTMRGDARLVQLILKNLVDNAVKYTSRGSVKIRSYRQGGETVLAVEDTGVGIPREDQQRVFERFYTVNQSRGGVDRGTGLGLAIVKHAVLQMNGRVELDSEPGRGTTVRCVFPRPATAAEPEPTTGALPVPDGHARA